MKTNIEQIVDFSKIAKKEKDWTLEKMCEIKAANPGMEFDEIVQMVKDMKEITIDDIIKLAEAEKMQPAIEDIRKRMVIVIDAQNDFHEGGALAVPGAREDTRRTIEFLYKWGHKITSILASLDTHTIYQIFHPVFWIDENGNHPDPYTVITPEDVAKGKYKPIINVVSAIDYVNGLASVGKKELCEWPLHCLQGTWGWLPEQQLMNMIYFHTVARKSRPQFYLKGQDSNSEMYGIFEKEYAKNGVTMTKAALKMLENIEEYDEIYFLGQAKSHCVLESMKQFLKKYKDRPEITSKVIFVIDCSSCVPGFEDVTEKEIDELVKNYGIKVMKSDEIQMD